MSELQFLVGVFIFWCLWWTLREPIEDRLDILYWRLGWGNQHNYGLSVLVLAIAVVVFYGAVER